MLRALPVVLSVVVSCFFSFSVSASGLPYVTYKVEGDYEDVLADIKDAIAGQGLLISSESHASEMLNRTGPDLGFDNPVFSHAVILGFCSAKLSHALVAADPNNMMFCPYGLGVYQLSGEMGAVHVTYRRPLGGNEQTQPVLDKIEALLQEIISEVK